jgi:Tol biopolymer transport system component
MRADGSHQRRVARLGGRPNYSPHGKRITFDRRFRGIWVMRADGSHTHRLTNHGDSDPAFSPNGKRIVFYRGTPQQIWVMHTDGSHAHPVTHGHADSSEPDWSVRRAR